MAFTEHRAIMLAMVLRSSRAVQMSVHVVRAFAHLRSAARANEQVMKQLEQLEARARDSGATHARLETNRVLTEALGMYRSAGYEEVPAFNDEPFGDHWFEKRLA